MSAVGAATVPEAVLEAIGALDAAEKLLHDLLVGDLSVWDARPMVAAAVERFGGIVTDAMRAAYGEPPDSDSKSAYDEWTDDTYSRATRIFAEIDVKSGGAA